MTKHTIDITPRWENLVPLFVDWISTGAKSQRQTAIGHIEQMAKICDIVKDHTPLINKAFLDAGLDIQIQSR